MDSPDSERDSSERLLNEHTEPLSLFSVQDHPSISRGHGAVESAANAISALRRIWLRASHRYGTTRLYSVGVLAAVVFMAILTQLFEDGTPSSLTPPPRVFDFGSTGTSSLPFLDPPADGRVIVTGGGGTIGLEVIRRLLRSSAPVTLLDVHVLPDEVEAILNEFPAGAALLKVTQGDVRDPQILQEAMSEDVVGVVHLAAIARKGWCRENEGACLDIAERGTQTVLSALSNLNQRDSGRRWFILGSSTDVYRNTSNVADAGYSANSALGTSKLKAENVLRHHLDDLSMRRVPGALHAISLRMSTVYGSVYDHVDRMVPSIVTQALTNQVIQVVGGQQQFDMLHISDAVEGVVLTIHDLTKKRNSWSISNSRTSLDIFDLVSDSSATVEELVDKVVRLTRSKSPLRYLPNDNLFPDTNHGRNKNVLKELSSWWRPTPVDEGLLRLVRDYLQEMEWSLKKRYDSTCGAASPSLTYNAEIEKLNDCYSSVAVDMAGELAIIQLGDKDGNRYWETSPEMPLRSRIRTFVKMREDGKPILSLRDLDSDRWLGLDATTVTEPGLVSLAVLSNEDRSAGKLSEWEMDVNKEDSTVRLVLAETQYQLAGPPTLAGNYSLISKDLDIYPFRIIPICCEHAQAPWPFFADDPNNFMLEYQKTSVKRPFLGSPTKALCNRLERAQEKAAIDLATLSLDRLAKPRPRMSDRPTEWSQADLPACSNLCDLPTICVNTSDCMCTLPICPARERFPFNNTAALEFRGAPPKSEFSRLVQLMEETSWKNVLRPQARQFVALGAPAKVHVGPLNPDESELRVNGGIDRLAENGHCFSVDTSLEDAMKLRGVKEEEADMTFVAFYQNSWYKYQLGSNYEYVQSKIKSFDPTKVIIPFSHDWGQCFTWDWDAWIIRAREGLKVDAYVRSSTAWTVMSDLNTRCYRPHQDVVVAPRTCLSPKLFEAFGDITKVKPSRDRRIFSSFKAGKWGTGIALREKTFCERNPVDQLAKLPDVKFKSDKELITLYNKFGDYPGYIDVIADSIFCPQPTGTTGWATRIIDSMYGGCVPVFIGQSAEYPFFDVIDWGKISVRIDPSDLNRLEEVLMERYTMEDVERLQANMMLVRDALVYPLDDVSDKERMDLMWERRGALWFALYNTGMRLATSWPMNDGWVSP